MTKLDLTALANMPGAGNARKELVKAGAWAPFMNDTERMDWMGAQDETEIHQDDRRIVQYFGGEFSLNDIRAAIDTAAKNQGTTS